MSPAASVQLPESLRVHHTPEAGRSLRATRPIPQGTVLLRIAKPAINVIYKEYRKEVCAFCFAYDLGRHWKIRDTDTGFSFCCEECKTKWLEELGIDGLDAHRAVGKWVAKKAGSSKPKPDEDGDLDMAEALPQPTVEQIDAAFSSVAARAALVREYRTAEKPSKRANRMLASVLTEPGAPPDVLYLLLSGILCLSKGSTPTQIISASAPENISWANAEEDLSIPYADLTPYFSHDELQDHVNAYLQLLAILPVQLLAVVSEASCRYITGVLFHNVFGLRSHDTLDTSQQEANNHLEDSNLEEPGSELMGDMLLTTVSLFNHSCSPNVRKVRVGRTWTFWAGQDIGEGEECCITYLGGEEKVLSRNERRDRLRFGWGFECACSTCTLSYV